MTYRNVFLLAAGLLCLAACSVEAPVAVDAVRAGYAEIEGRDEHHNAFISTNREQALQRAAAVDAQMSDAPLRGITLAVKDNIFTADFPTTGGTSVLQGFRLGADAAVVAQLRAAGAVVVGKTNLHELAFGITSNNYAFGAVHNAYKNGYFSGGSSGGTAVAVALGMARAGLCTDTGGSCRIPAALNNIVGFRPSSGRYSADGLIKISHTRDTAGIMARTVADVVLLDGVLVGDADSGSADGGVEEPLRLGVPRVFYQNTDPQVAQVMRSALDAIRASGVVLVERDLPGIFALNDKVSFPVVLYETGELLPAFLQEHDIGLSLSELVETIASPDVKQVISGVAQGAIAPDVYREAINAHRPALQAVFVEYFAANNLDAMILPTTPLPAQPIDTSDETVMLNGKQVPTFPTFIRNVDPSSNAGLPAVSIPAGFTQDGLPIGLEIEAPYGSDKKLLRIAERLQKILNVQPSTPAP